MNTKDTKPGHDWFSDDVAVTDPGVFSTDIEADSAVMCFAPYAYSTLLDILNLEDADECPTMAGLIEGRHNSSAVVSRCCFGAPAAALHFETLIASGIESAVMLGTAGSISKECSIGDVVIPVWGIREEGTSYHYLPAAAECRPGNVLLQRVRKALQPATPKEGGVWTTDAILRETREKAETYSQMGVLAVEMECTALMSVAIYRNVDFAAVLVITDELSGENWVRGFGSEPVHSAKRECATLLASIFAD